MRRFTAYIFALALFGFLLISFFTPKAFAAYGFECLAGLLDQGSCASNKPPNSLNYQRGQDVCDYLADYYTRTEGKDITASCTDYCYIGVGPYNVTCNPITKEEQASYMCAPRPGPLMSPDYVSRSCSASTTDAGNAGYCCNYTVASNPPPTTPTCDSDVVCSNTGACVAENPNTCSVNNGNRINSGCEYTTYTKGGTQTATSSCTRVSTGSTVKEPCTVDACDKDNGYACDANKQCALPPQCTTINDVKCVDANPCTLDTCNLSTNKCSYFPAPDGTPYDIRPEGNLVCCNGQQSGKASCTATCRVTTDPSTKSLTVGGDTADITARVENVPTGRTIKEMLFGSYNTAVATVNPGDNPGNPYSPYSTTVTGVAEGNTAVWATAKLDNDDEILCQSNENTDTNITVSKPTSSGTTQPGTCSITLSDFSPTLNPGQTGELKAYIRSWDDSGVEKVYLYQVRFDMPEPSDIAYAKPGIIGSTSLCGNNGPALSPVSTIIYGVGPGQRNIAITATQAIMVGMDNGCPILAPGAQCTAQATVKVQPYSIKGSVFIDTDNDGIKDIGEKCYAGNASISLSGANIATQTQTYPQDVGCNSQYIFAGLNLGTYNVSISEIPQISWSTLLSIPITFP